MTSMPIKGQSKLTILLIISYYFGRKFSGNVITGNLTAGRVYRFLFWKPIIYAEALSGFTPTFTLTANLGDRRGVSMGKHDLFSCSAFWRLND
jgi:hypothetical protein